MGVEDEEEEEAGWRSCLFNMEGCVGWGWG
jgi:hypothetical protein